jgi:hypothetical protein
MQERTLFVSGAPSGRCTPVGILDRGALSEMLSNISESTRFVDGLLVVAGAVAMLVLTHSGPGMANDTSRLATAQAVVEHGTLAIDGTHFEYTVDKIRVDGQYYSDKPPLLSLYLAALYFLATTLFGWTVAADLPTVYYTLSLGSSGLAFLATLLGARRLAGAFGASAPAAGLAAAAAGFGTLLFPYATVISSHAAAAPFLTWFAVAVVEGALGVGAVRDRDSPMGGWRPVLTGMLGASTVVIEPLASVFVAPLGFAYTLDDWQSAIGLFVGALLPLLPHAALSYEIAGNPVLMNLNAEYFDDPGSMHRPENLSGVGWAHDSLPEFFRYAYHSLVGYRGWVMYNVPAALGLGWAVWALAANRHRRFAGALLAGTAVFFGLTLGWTSNCSGWAYGVRWHTTPAPLCASCVGLALAAGSERVRRLGWIGLVVSLALGTASAVPATLDPWTPSTQEEYSVIEVVSGEPVYVKEHLDAARLHLSAGRPQEARYQAEHALRRNPAVVPAWRVAIATSKRLDDGSRLRSYVERLGDRESLDPDVRERLE